MKCTTSESNNGSVLQCKCCRKRRNWPQPTFHFNDLLKRFRITFTFKEQWRHNKPAMVLGVRQKTLKVQRWRKWWRNALLWILHPCFIFSAKTWWRTTGMFRFIQASSGSYLDSCETGRAIALQINPMLGNTMRPFSKGLSKRPTARK